MLNTLAYTPGSPPPEGRGRDSDILCIHCMDYRYLGDSKFCFPYFTGFSVRKKRIFLGYEDFLWIHLARLTFLVIFKFYGV